jgi:hypothetical protein
LLRWAILTCYDVFLGTPRDAAGLKSGLIWVFGVEAGIGIGITIDSDTE